MSSRQPASEGDGRRQRKHERRAAKAAAQSGRDRSLSCRRNIHDQRPCQHAEGRRGVRFAIARLRPYVSTPNYGKIDRALQMARAFIFVLDSFGIGGAADAAAFGDEGSDTFGHIAAACDEGRGDRDGLRSGPLELPNMMSLGLGEAAAIATGRRRRDRCGNGKPTGFFGAADEVSSGKDTPSGHWEIAAVPVPFQWGYFPQTVPTFPADPHRGHHPRGGPARHSRRLPRLRHRDHRAVRRGAYPHRQADLLHLRRLGPADRRARDAFRARAALRAVQDRAQAGRPAQYRPRHRQAVRRRDQGNLRAHRQPARLRRAAAGADAARPAGRSAAAR